MLVLMLMSHASVDLFVLSFVLPCAYAYVASENQALRQKSLTVKCFIYRIYLKDRELRTETLYLTTGTWRLISNDFLLI